MNLDLVAIEEVELSKEQRENLAKVAVENLHNNSINKFIEEQDLFHNSNRCLAIRVVANRRCYSTEIY